MFGYSSFFRLFGACLFLFASINYLSGQYSLPHRRFDYKTEKNKSVQSAPGLKSYPVYTEGTDSVFRINRNGKKSLGTAPSTHDFLQLLPPQNREDYARLVISHELKSIKKSHPQFGEGGAVAILNLKKGTDTQFKLAGKPQLVDFAPVGWTTQNCGGGAAPGGNLFTAEEIFDAFNHPDSVNKRKDNFSFDLAEAGYKNGLFTIPKSYPEFGGKTIPIHKNFGYMVEFDPDKAVALHKCYHMGRYSHESAVFMPDRKTVYLTDDYAPACLFKFIADKAGDYRAGNLFAYGHKSGAGRWISIPRDLDSLTDARNVAIRKGAALFMRLEWAVLNPTTGNVYFCETGRDRADLKAFADDSGKYHPALHWKERWAGNIKKCLHRYGSVLELNDKNPDGPAVRALLEGGNYEIKGMKDTLPPDYPRPKPKGKDEPAIRKLSPEEVHEFNYRPLTFPRNGGFNAASFDGLTYARIAGRDWLVIHEDLIDTTHGRMSVGSNYEIPEAFLLDLSISNPQPEDLHPIFLGARGSELAGGTFSNDGKYFFINHQHPNPDNAPDCNRSATWVVTGWENHLAGIPALEPQAQNLKVHPNPIFGTLHFNRILHLTVKDENDNILFTQEGKDFVKLAHLPKGRYTVYASYLENQKWTVEITEITD